MTESTVQTTVGPEAILPTDVVTSGGEDEETIQTKMPQLMLDKLNKTVFVVTAVDIEHMNNTPTWITPPPTTPSSVTSEIPPLQPAVTIQTNFTSTPSTPPATVETSTPSAGPSGIPDSTRTPAPSVETSTASAANNASANLAEFNATLFQSVETVPQRQGLDYLGVSRGSCTSSR